MSLRWEFQNAVKKRENKNIGAKEVLLAHAPHGKMPRDRKKRRLQDQSNNENWYNFIWFLWMRVACETLNNPLHRASERTNARTKKEVDKKLQVMTKGEKKEFMAKVNKFDSNAVALDAVRQWDRRYGK